MKKLIAILICIVMTFSLAFSVACAGPQGQQGNTPQLRISQTTNEWEVSYDNGESWTSLGVKATGPKGEQGLQGGQGQQGNPGSAGENGTKIEIGENGNWFIDGVDSGIKASCDCENSSGSTDPDQTEFVPITRFVVTSDVHLRVDGAYQSQERLDSVFDTAYAYAESQADYTDLDAIFFVGDNTQNGYESEQTAFFDTVAQKVKGDTVVRAVMGNHEYYATGHYTESSMAQGPLNFIEYSGYEDDDVHLEIDGYHYIMLSMDKYGGSTGKAGEYLSETKLAWLKERLDVALADDPTGEKPIFVFQHVHAKNTVLGSTGADEGLRALLDDYPNVVDFSGHTHRPLTDPRVIWQDTFTALGTGSMAYVSTNIAGHPLYDDDTGVQETVDAIGAWTTNFETGARNGVMYYICEIDENNEMRILRYNVLTNSVWGDPIMLDSFGDPSGFDYTDERKYSSEMPAFSAGAGVIVSKTKYNSVELIFPQATCKDVVQNYRIEVYANDELVTTEYRLSRSYLGNAMPNMMTVKINGLNGDTEYNFKIYPVNSYGVIGVPLTTTITTPEVPAFPEADILRTRFNDDGTATNLADSSQETSTLKKFGTPTVTLDSTLNKNVVTIDANPTGQIGEGYGWYGIESWYSSIANRVSMELYIYCNELPDSGFDYIFSNQQNGGFGIKLGADGTLKFFHSSATTETTTIETEKWIHIVAVFDGSTLSVYKNGQLDTSVAISGTFRAPDLTYMCIGGDSEILSGAERSAKSFQGMIATANIYSDALTATQIANLYSVYPTE
ncbi:MAG: metallophosphoesterase [Clostridia bacterium]|nr:metallophosphoesterase [Clostridia bacterium]